ncbi:MAG: HD domain-containing protein [Candidatus Bathyarchaeia archaeon]
MDCKELKGLFAKISRNVEEVSGNIHFFFHYPFHDLRHCQNMYQCLEDLRNYVWLEYSELWSLRIAIYLHDIGMFINPRYWHKLGVPVDGLSSPGKDLIRELEEDAIVKSLLENLGMNFEDAFFGENGCLRLPPPLKEKPWDEFSFIEKTAIRVVMRTFHPQIGDWSVRKRFIGEYPLECRKFSEMIGGIVRLHEDETDGRIRNLGLWEIAGSPSGVDQKKLIALLILLDSLDCAGQSRASPEALDEIIDEVRMLEEKAIETEARKGGDADKRYGHLPHWVFKKYIKEVRINPDLGQIAIVTETSSPSYLAGTLFFEIANNVWPKYVLASSMLEEHGFHFDLTIQMPDQAYGMLLLDEELVKLGDKFRKTVVEASDLPQKLREKYEISKLRLPRALALLLGHGGTYNEYADQLAKKHVCRLLAEVSSEQRSQLEQIFKCG